MSFVKKIQAHYQVTGSDKKEMVCPKCNHICPSDECDVKGFEDTLCPECKTPMSPLEN